MYMFTSIWKLFKINPVNPNLYIHPMSLRCTFDDYFC